jgi:hypothetical protein
MADTSHGRRKLTRWVVGAAAMSMAFACLSLLPLETARAEGSSLSLLNADDGTVIIDSFNYSGDVLNLAELPPRLTIVDSLFGATAGSVEFFLNGQSVRTENVAPYALGGDVPPGVFIPYDLPIGPTTIRTVYYQLAHRGGQILGESSIQFEVINVEPVELIISPTPVTASVPAGGRTKTSFFIEVGDVDFDYDLVLSSTPPAWAVYPQALQVGKNVIQLRADNLPPGEYFADPLMVQLRARDFTYVQTLYFDLILTVKPSNALLVSGFTVVDAVSNLDASASLFGPISFNVVDLPEVFGVRANTYPETVGSVVLEFAFQPDLTDPPAFPQPSVRVENVVPYSLFGDSLRGDYAGVPRQTGWLWVRATPHRLANGRGQTGTPLELLVYIYPN